MDDVAVRLIRQRRLTSEEDPLELVAILDEAALRREIGGSDVMRAQLCHLIDIAALPSVTLQVLSLHAGPHSGMDGAFTLLGFPEPGEQDLLYHEYVTGALHVEDQDVQEPTTAPLVFPAIAFTTFLRLGQEK